MIKHTDIKSWNKNIQDPLTTDLTTVDKVRKPKIRDHRIFYKQKNIDVNKKNKKQKKPYFTFVVSILCVVLATLMFLAYTPPLNYIFSIVGLIPIFFYIYLKYLENYWKRNNSNTYVMKSSRFNNN